MLLIPWLNASVGITTRMLSARDDALRRVGTDGPSYIITTVKDYPRNNTARQISGAVQHTQMNPSGGGEMTNRVYR